MPVIYYARFDTRFCSDNSLTSRIIWDIQYVQGDTAITGELSASSGEFVRGIFGRLAPVLSAGSRS